MPEFKMDGMSTLYSDGVFYNLKKAAEAAITCLVWTEELSDDDHGGDWSKKYISKELTWSVIGDLATFCAYPEIEDVLERYGDKFSYEWLGHKFYLSANGHGTGLWDSPESKIPQSALDLLHNVAGEFERHLYCDDDDQLRSE